MTQDQQPASAGTDSVEAPDEPPKQLQRDMALHLPSAGVGAKIGTPGSAAGTPAQEIPSSQPATQAASPSGPNPAPASNQDLRPDVLANKLDHTLKLPPKAPLARADSSTAPPSASLSTRATPGNSTPGTDVDSDAELLPKMKSPPASGAQGARKGEVQATAQKPSYIQPLSAPRSPDDSPMPSRASTMPSEPEAGTDARRPSASNASAAPPASTSQAQPPPQRPSARTAGSGSDQHAKLLSDIRSASPNKINGRPAVFSAIPRDKDRDASPAAAQSSSTSRERPPLPTGTEKKSSVLGKMFGAMKSSEHLGDGQHHHGLTKEQKEKEKKEKKQREKEQQKQRGRSRGDSHGESGYESESGTESDASAASIASARTERSDRGFLKLSRKASGGNNNKKDAYAGSQQEKAAALAAEGSNSNMPPPPPLSRRSSEKKHDGNRSESGSVAGSIGQSLKDMVTGPLMQRKPSLHSNRSYDGKSEHGEEHEESASRKGGNTTTSLLKKYGACEKVAIGRGATAVVRLAHKWDKSTEKLYAVKEFRKRRKNESEKDYVKKLTSEFCISSTLHHANIVETVDLVQDENHHWCEVMEYCPNGDLYAAIKKGDLNQAQINTYFQQMVSGVAYLHSMGVAHRDIKPENLLLDAHNVIKITDFGVSDVFRMCWEKTCHLSRGLCGSEPYIAPEQFEPKAQYDARLVDVWACAIVYYCMQFQELPWRIAKLTDPSFGAFADAYHNTNSPPPLADIHPRECRALIKQMLCPNPKERITAENIISSNKWFQSLLPANSTAPAGGVASPSAEKGGASAKDPLAHINVPPPPSPPVVKDLLNR